MFTITYLQNIERDEPFRKLWVLLYNAFYREVSSKQNERVGLCFVRAHRARLRLISSLRLTSRVCMDARATCGPCQRNHHAAQLYENNSQRKTTQGNRGAFCSIFMCVFASSAISVALNLRSDRENQSQSRSRLFDSFPTSP